LERAEIVRFENTVEAAKRENEIGLRELQRLKPIVDELFRQANVADNYDVLQQYQLHAVLLARAQRMAHTIELAIKQPYFTRVDFVPEGKSATDTYYIGKYGFMDSETMESIVVDWRSPIANLYYSGQIGPTHYETPDGRIDGDLTKKRQFYIDDGKLISYYDADVISQDKLLNQVLSSVSQGKLKEVVTTIQAEQNRVIRHPLNKNLIVQGVAGSGKTTIALHRIAYLLYAYQDTLLPKTLMIIAPNPLFLDYISGVLPDLGVSDVHQTTFDDLCAQLLGKHMIKLSNRDRLSDALKDPSWAAEIRAVSKRKGSFRYLDEIDDFLDEVEQTLKVDEDIRFGPVTIYTKNELNDMLLKDLRHMPMNLRMDAVVKNSKARVKNACARVIELLEEDCMKRADIIRGSMPDSPERRERLKRLYASRDNRVEEAKAYVSKFGKEFKSRWNQLDIKELYAQFLGEEKIKTIESEDLPALVWMCRRVWGISNKITLKHIIIDEAQDFTPAQMRLLNVLFNNPTYTLVGDMGQNIHFYRGVTGWNQAGNAINGADECTLVTSYRSTIEVMTLANKIASRWPYDGQVDAVPVLRHGDEPEFINCAGEKERIRAINERVALYTKEKKYNSVCIIENNAKNAAKTAKAIDGARLLNPLSKDYSSGVCVAAIDQVKGLEFDAVILAEASEQSYPDRAEYARLLYVASTRPLHALTVVSLDKPSALFEGKKI